MLTPELRRDLAHHKAALVEALRPPAEQLDCRWRECWRQAQVAFAQGGGEPTEARLQVAAKLLLDLEDDWLPEGLTPEDAKRWVEELASGQLDGRLLESGRVCIWENSNPI